MNHTGYISVVKASISPGSCHFEIKITQTLVSISLDFVKTISDENWNLKVHKNQCFNNDQLLCVKCSAKIACHIATILNSI